MKRFTVIAATLEEFLRGEDFEVGVAADATAALALIEALEPDIALLDIQLPDRSGLEVFRELQAENSKRPVIFVTAHGTTETAIEAMKGGAFDYLVKPIDLERLTQLIKRAFEAARLILAVPRNPSDAMRTRVQTQRGTSECTFR